MMKNKRPSLAPHCDVCHKVLTQRVMIKGRLSLAVSICDKCSKVLCHRCREWDGVKGVYFCKKGCKQK